MPKRALRRKRPECRRETAGERLERVSQAKRQSRSPQSKVERDGIPGDGAQRAEVLYISFLFYGFERLRHGYIAKPLLHYKIH